MSNKFTERTLHASAVTLCILLTLGSEAAQSTIDTTVKISVSNITTSDGYVMAALYDEAGWGKEPVDSVRLAVSEDTLTISLTAPKPGQYGIRLYHDVDGNGKLNANVMGIPTEPFGFSNNAPPRFGPPPFSAAAFEIGEGGVTQAISL